MKMISIKEPIPVAASKFLDGKIWMDHSRFNRIW